MDRIKITFFLQNLEVGGAERSIVRLANILDKDCFDVSFLLCSKTGNLLKALPEDIKIFGLKSKHVSLSLFRVVNYFNTEKPDIVISVLDHVNIISIIASLFCKIKPKIIITERSTFTRVSTHSASKLKQRLISRFILPVLVKILYKRADSIVCVSQGVADDISGVIGNLPTIKVIYNPVVDTEKIEKLINEPLEEPIDNSLPNILAVGRLTKAKDYFTMLKAFSLVLKEVPANLLIIGEGEERWKIEKAISDLNISKNVVLLGLQKNPFKYMAKADVFVLSSILEGFPNVLVEAMACGMSVISTDCQSGPNEIIENEKSGLLVPVGSEKKLAEAVVKLLKDGNLRDRFSKNAKIRAKYFSADNSAREFKNLFKKVLEE